MKSFLDHLKEEVLPTVQVADGGLDIEKPAVRAAINAAIAGVTSQPAVTPYVVFNRLSKLLARYHIILPKKFLEGDKGVEVFEIRQFGHRMGMTDSGEFVNDVPSTHYLFLQYGILSPFGITYAKPVVGGMFRVMARLVDKVELDKLLDMAEISLAEEAEVNQAIAKANAPKEPMHDITSDEKKKGNKAAVATSEKGLDEAMTRKQKNMAVRRFMSHDPKAGESILAMGKKDREEKKSFASAKKEIKSLKEDEQIDEISTEKLVSYRNKAGEGREKGSKLAYAKLTGKAKVKASAPKTSYMEEDKDPCWKGYEMIGMKKKSGKPVPNCVPVKEEEEQIDETHADNIRRKYREKEDSNDHTGNVHLLTRTFGSKKEREASKEMLRKRDKQGYSSSSDSQKGYKITKKYASRLDKLKEATDKDRDLSKLAADAVSKGHPVKKIEPGRAEGSSLRKGMAKGYNIEKGRWSGHGKFGLGEEQIDEKAPPGAKYERMVKHIKKGYAKDGLTAKEKGIAFATAWKAKNRQVDEEKKEETVLVSPKGYKGAGKVKRIPKKDYDPAKHNLASE